MIINSTTGQASIMGTDRRFFYDHAQSALVLRDLTFDEASTIIKLLEGKNVLVERTGKVNADAGGGEQLDLVAHAATQTNGAGKKALAVDPDKIAALAAANPAPPPKAPKEPKKPKAAPKVEEDDDDGSAEDTRAAAPDDDDDIPHAESKSLPVTNGKAAKAAKPAPEPEEEAEEAEEEEEEEAPPPKKGPKVPEALKTAKKLRDVLAYLMQGDKANGVKKITDPDALKAKCEELKESVPCLARITDLEARIDRTLEVMDLSDDVS